MRLEIEKILIKTLKKFYKNDIFLIEQNVNERSISHKIAVYLQEEISKKRLVWDVDCEYNRIGEYDAEFIPKRLGIAIKSDVASNDTEAKTVFPDIIIHHRGKNGEDDNLLVIEIKKNKKKDEFDFEKIDKYGKELKYQFGVFLNITKKKTLINWWEKGMRKFENDDNAIVLYEIM